MSYRISTRSHKSSFRATHNRFDDLRLLRASLRPADVHDEETEHRWLIPLSRRDSRSQLLQSQINERLCAKVCYVNLLQYVRANEQIKEEVTRLAKANNIQTLKKVVQLNLPNFQFKLQNFSNCKLILTQSRLKQLTLLLTEDVLKMQTLGPAAQVSDLPIQKLEFLLKSLEEIKRKNENEMRQSSSHWSMKFKLAKSPTSLKLKQARSIAKSLIKNSNLKFPKRNDRKASLKFQGKQQTQSAIEQEISSIVRKVMDKATCLPQGLLPMFSLALKYNFKINHQNLPICLDKSTLKYLQTKAKIVSKPNQFMGFKLQEIDKQYLNQLQTFKGRSKNPELTNLNLLAAFGSGKAGLEIKKKFYQDSFL